ncbi:MAG: hypothetical protein V2B18_21590, partial [Pseudomonadota bacterium]
MEGFVISDDQSDDTRGGRFLKYIRLFAAIKNHDKLFPKLCRTCGTQFRSFSEYLCRTKPKGHVF